MKTEATVRDWLEARGTLALEVKPSLGDFSVATVIVEHYAESGPKQRAYVWEWMDKLTEKLTRAEKRENVRS